MPINTDINRFILAMSFIGVDDSVVKTKSNY